MKELNDYNIHNADGNVPCSNEGKVSYQNDSPRFVSESMQSEHGEAFQVKESFEPAQQSDFGSMEVGGVDVTSSATSSASSAASATSSVASAASSIGGSFGALAGVVASSVATVAMVVAVFVSTLVINLTLAMADMHSLVFEVEMTGAQEEDFEDPIWAILTGEDGTHQEQEVKQDTVLLTFEGLEPNTEYLIRIKNSEKVFVEKAYFTASKPLDKGTLTAFMQDAQVFVLLKGVKLSRGEYYTVTAKDADGTVVFSKDGVDSDAEYTFTLDAPKSLYFSASVGGKAFALSQIEVEQKPNEHTHTYGELIPLVEPMCSTPGMLAHYYCAECGKYFDENMEETTEEALVIPATGHDYAFDSFVWTDDHSIARAKFVCANNTRHWYWEDAVVESEVLVARRCEEDGVILYTATYGDYVDEQRVVEAAYGHRYQYFDEQNATCDKEGMLAHYYCEGCGKYFYEEGREATREDFVIPALGHQYGEPKFNWTPTTSGYEATALFTCARNTSHQEQVNAQVTFSGGIYEAVVTFDGKRYNDSFDPNVTLTFGEDSTRIYVTPKGYGRSDEEMPPVESDMTPFVTSDRAYIKISGDSEYTGEVINVYQLDDSEAESNVYIVFENLNVDTNGNGAVVCFNPTTTMNVHVAFSGSTSLYSGGCPLFTSMGSGAVNVYLYMHENDEDMQVEMDFEESYGGCLFATEIGEIHVYIPQEEDTPGSFEWISVTSDYKKKPAAPAGSGVASVDDGYVRVYADGYTDANGEYSFENTSTSNYVISGECTGDNPLVISTSNKDGSSAGVQKVTYYLTFEDLTLTASGWASAFCIKTSCDLELHIVYKGAVSITGYNHPAFSLEGGYDIIIYMDPYDSASTFNYGRQYGSSPKLYGSGDNSYGGNVRFVLDGTEVDRDGNVL